MKKTLPLLAILLMIGFVIASKIEWKSDLIFSHQFHHSEAEVECTACHQQAEASTSGKDDLLPEMETCYDCHDEDDSDCADCHKIPDDPVILPRVETYSIKFNHKLHFEKDISCTTCHSGILEKDEVETVMHLPGMESCMTCHETPATMAGCYSCHVTTDVLKPADHGVAWNNNHGMVAESGSQNCTSCHSEDSCIDCHQGENVMNQSHPAQFIVTHSMSFMVRESDCASCHASRQFCVDCHMNMNRILPVDHLVNWSTLHADAAKTDYERCLVCHDSEGTLCAKCHN